MHLSIVNDRLQAGGRAVAFAATPNQGGRMEPTMIVGHDTADRLQPGDSVSWFQNPKSKVSAHLVLGRDATWTQLVDFDRVAWHAGKSSWRGRANCNAFAIGIEIDNPGPLKRKGDAGVAWYGESYGIAQNGLVYMKTAAHGEALWMPYTREQLNEFEAFIRAAMIAYPSIADVAGHFEIAPKRKVDVGPHFPMAHMRAILADRQSPNGDTVSAAQMRLTALGYGPGEADGILGVRTRGAIRTFQEQNGLQMTGALDRNTVAALLADGAKSMPMSAREGTTKAELRTSGSSTMRNAAVVKRGAEGFGLLTLIDATAGKGAPPAVPAAEASPLADAGALDGLGNLVAQGEQARGLGGHLVDLGHWLQSSDGLGTALTLCLVGLVWWAANNVEWSRLRDHVLGRNVGG